jgi:dihydrofolate synthase / folylpolyglutamate synthase
MNYQQALAYIESLSPTLTKPCLERIAAFVSQNGNPQDRFASLHIGGTNGKGSTVAIVDSLLRSGGMKVGRFTGPHLLKWNERFHINGEPISDEEFARVATMIHGLSQAFSTRNPEFGPLTWFEFLTAMAFFYFAEQQIDIAVFEVGLGGRWDATNVIDPIACAITTISLDHTQILGDTVRRIAQEKAGIIKPHVPIMTATTGDALEEILMVAREKESPVFQFVEPDSLLMLDSSKVAARDLAVHCEYVKGFASARNKLSLGGQHQQTNAMVACGLLLAADLQTRVDLRNPGKALQDVFWPGRFQYMPKISLLLDGAHNPAGAAALREALDEKFPHRQIVFVLSCFQNKDVPTMIAALLRPGDRVIASEASTKRATCPANELVAIAQNLGADAITMPNIGAALRNAMETRGRDELIVATGSFATVKECMLEMGFKTVDDSLRLTLRNWNDVARMSC